MDQVSERRIAENEVIFRRHNEAMQQKLDEFKKMAKESDEEYFVEADDKPLRFYCECADEKCRQRILIKPSEYKAIHKNRSYFTILKGHEIKEVEQVIRQEPGFEVVEKFKNPPESASELNPIDIER